MSGLLRRIKRSRPADAGEAPTEGQAAAPEGGAAPQGEPAPTPDAGTPGDASTEAAAPRAWLSNSEPEQPAAERSDAESPRPVAATPESPKPVLLANPDAPAGLELENQTAPRAPAGRRGRLRRRLRYLRRARELMLRDLGGLLYEVHRSGGADVDAHATVLTAKVQRISGLDAEAHALESALAAPRPDAVLFEPGIGGTCPNCGELFSSAAHFCANCGASVTDLPAPPAPVGQLAMDVEAATPAPDVQPFGQAERQRFWHKVIGARKGAAAAPAAVERPADAEPATEVIEPGADAPATTPGLPATAPDAPGTTGDEQPGAAEPAPGLTDTRQTAEPETSAAPARGAGATESPATTTDAPGATRADAPAEAASDPADARNEPTDAENERTDAENEPTDAALEPADAPSAPADEPAGPAEDTAERAATPDEPPHDAPHGGERSNGAGRTPPERAEGDPLVTRRSRS